MPRHDHRSLGLPRSTRLRRHNQAVLPPLRASFATWQMTTMVSKVWVLGRCEARMIEGSSLKPARDFTLSKQFYQDLRFTIAWSDSDLAYLRCGTAVSFSKISTIRSTRVIS